MKINIITPDDAPDDVIVEVYDDYYAEVSSGAATISPDGMLRDFVNYFPMKSSGILPPGLVYTSEDQGLIVFERPPMYAEIVYTHAAMHEVENAVASGGPVVRNDYMIPLPWLLYVATVSPTNDPLNIWVYAMRSQITSMDDRLGIFPLPNFYEDSRLCMAPQTNFSESLTIASAINAVYEAVWSSHFNADLFHLFQQNFPHFVSSIHESPLSDFLNSTQKKKPTLTKAAPAKGFFDWWSNRTLLDMLEVTLIDSSHSSLRSIISAYNNGSLGANAEPVEASGSVDRFFVSRFLTAMQNNAIKA